jgi:sec-independent protein translocase protein TatC
VLTILSVLFTYFVMMPTILNFFVAWNASFPAQPVAAAALPEGVTLPVFPVLGADPMNPPPGSMWINTSINELRTCIAAGAEGAPPLIRGTPLRGDSLIDQEFKVSQTIDLLFNLALAFAVAFQMPVVVLVLGWVGIVTPDLLVKYRKHAIMVCAVLGSVLTPGDPLSMFLLAVPLYLLFEFGVLLLRLLPASRVAGKRGGVAAG